MSGPTLRGIFNRVDTNRDGSLERAEVKKFVEDAGVDSGLFGGKKVSGATDAFVDTFDGDKNGNVSWQEFQAKGQSLIPGAAKDATPAQVQEAADKLVSRADANGDATVSRDELKNLIEPELEKAGVGMAGTKAEIGAKLGVAMLDENRDGNISKAEVDSLAKDVSAQLALARTRTPR